jgi:hypothetical protein
MPGKAVLKRVFIFEFRPALLGLDYGYENLGVITKFQEKIWFSF